METLQTSHGAAGLEPVQAPLQAEQERFDALLSRYSPALYRIALRKLGNAEDAEDALQDALLSAFKNMHQFRGDAQLSTWLGSIVLNSARMQLRRRLNHVSVSLDDTQEDGRPVWAERLQSSAMGAEETLRHIQTRQHMERVVKKLPVRLRVAFRLRVFEGLSTSEAASVVGIPEGTLKARFFRARVQVIAHMRKAANWPRRRKSHHKRHSVANPSGW